MTTSTRSEHYAQVLSVLSRAHRLEYSLEGLLKRLGSGQVVAVFEKVLGAGLTDIVHDKENDTLEFTYRGIHYFQKHGSDDRSVLTITLPKRTTIDRNKESSFAGILSVALSAKKIVSVVRVEAPDIVYFLQRMEGIYRILQEDRAINEDHPLVQLYKGHTKGKGSKTIASTPQIALRLANLSLDD